MKSLARVVGIVALLTVIAACAPTHTIKPLPDFVSTGLEASDKVTVTTNGGEVHTFEVREVRGNLLIGEDIQFDLRKLASIKKHAWSRPDSPCGGEKPLGCSVPFLVAIASESHAHYEEKFYDACAQHDYCYRHGYASYGTDRESCDENFLVDMQALCPQAAVTGVGKVFEALDGSLDSRHTCLGVAKDYYGAVRRYGEKKFLTETSTFCAYDGPNQLLQRASGPSSPRQTGDSPEK
ncbi:MAG: hypothetical protein AAF385_01495 [Pseudomonadota bacterium]